MHTSYTVYLSDLQTDWPVKKEIRTRPDKKCPHLNGIQHKHSIQFRNTGGAFKIGRPFQWVSEISESKGLNLYVTCSAVRILDSLIMWCIADL